MADQLTSIGVEFNKNEMARIFYRSHPDSDIRPWGLGKICATTGATAIPDKIWNTVTWPVSKFKGQDPDSLPRLPGLYKDDDGKTDLVDSKDFICLKKSPLPDEFIHPNEFIHPSVRIRIECGGLDLDDSRKWEYRALKMNGYDLTSQKDPLTDGKKRERRVADALQPYYTVSGVTLPLFDVSEGNLFTKAAQDYSVEAESYSTDAKIGAPRYVVVEQPRDIDLRECKTPEKYYFWKNKKTGLILREEHVGIWERMFAKVNAKKLEWAAADQRVAKKSQEQTEANRWGITKWAFGSSLNPAGNGKYDFEDVVSW